MEDARGLYLDLMKRSLTNLIYGDKEADVYSPYKNPIKRRIVRFFNSKGITLVKTRPMDPEKRADGSDRSPMAYTMIGMKRLDNYPEVRG